MNGSHIGSPEPRPDTPKPVDVQVTPEVEAVELAHVFESTCWCQPVIDYEDPITGARVYVHRATFDGPAYEGSQA